MSGSNYTIACKKCKAENPARGKAMTLSMTCPKCGTYFTVGQWNKDMVNFNFSAEPALPIGAKGKIDGTVYEIMGFMIKQESKYHYRWREYLLFNPMMGYAFLSEYNGNWNFIWPVEDDPRQQTSQSNFYHEQYFFRLYQKYRAQVVYARGEFFFDVVGTSDSTVNEEFIAPPYLYALEESGDSVMWCKGEYLKPIEVAQAFNIPIGKLPAKSGIGYTQPIATGFKEETLTRFAGLLLVLIIGLQLFFSTTSSEKTVFQGHFDQQQLGEQKFFVTPSFNLEGSSKSLEIHIRAPLSNDWLFAEFSLINEDNGNEYSFTKDIEYYFGYEGGESWSEGSNAGEAFISEIPAGKYHINIYPEFSVANHEFDIWVIRDVHNWSNFFIILLALGAFPLGYYIRKHVLEQRRWSDSDYSPYITE